MGPPSSQHFTACLLALSRIKTMMPQDVSHTPPYTNSSTTPCKNNQNLRRRVGGVFVGQHVPFSLPIIATSHPCNSHRGLRLTRPRFKGMLLNSNNDSHPPCVADPNQTLRIHSTSMTLPEVNLEEFRSPRALTPSKQSPQTPITPRSLPRGLFDGIPLPDTGKYYLFTFGNV